MADLIDRDAARKAVENQCVDGKMYGSQEGDTTLIDAYDVIDSIMDIPIVDAVPVVHGRWIPSKKHKPWFTCSECEGCYVDGEWVDGHKWSYCPNCGAKMNLEDKR